MTEIRPIEEPEAEGFLQLLCTVFDLDYSRAHSIFFAEPLFDLSRKWALFERGRMVSILTTVALEFGWGRAVGIAGVATLQDRQGESLAAKLIEHVAAESGKRGEGALLLFARDTRLYERLGFKALDRVVRGEIETVREREIPLGMEYEDVRLAYDQWSRADPNRLRRDELRWKYWRWNLRVCTPLGDGYLCLEGGTVREAVFPTPPKAWPLPDHSEWLGLSSMAEHVGVRLREPVLDLFLMGLNVSAVPQMFMTDQF